MSKLVAPLPRDPWRERNRAGSVPEAAVQSPSRLSPWPVIALVAMVALGAWLRLSNLAVNPGWDGDEGYNYNIALNLAHGHRQMFALSFVFVQHPPLFFALAAALFHLLGASMLTVRLLSVLFSLGAMVLLLPLAREFVADDRLGARVGLLAALAYAVLPLVVLQNRFGYTYNALAFWTALALLGLLRYRRTGRRGDLILAGLAGAAALVTDQEAAYLLPVLLFGLGRATPRRRAAVVALALAGPGLYVGAMALADRAALLFDLTHTAGRVAGGSIAMQAAMWVYNLAGLMQFDLAIPIGLAGLALTPQRPARRVVVGLLAVMLLVILKVRDPNPLFRTAEPLLPPVCLGLGLLASTVWTRVAAAAHRATGTRRGAALGLSIAVLVALPAVAYDAHAAATRFPTRIDGLLPRSTAAAEAMAAWLNRRLAPRDAVLAMPQVSWLLHARTAELLQAVAIQGKATAFYPAGIAARRWVYDVHLRAARYLVVDDFTRAWIAQNRGERALVGQAERTWRRVYDRGEYQVYENPAVK